MNFSQETQQKMNQFTKEQSRYYLDAAEMTYWEKLRRKSEQSKRKLGKKLMRFQAGSDQGREAQNDMLLYMSDYMTDLITKGMTEQEAFARASEELQSASDSEYAAGLEERFRQYYTDRNPADYEAVGLFYGGFLFLGFTVGGLIGFLNSGGREAFLTGGWIETLIGAGVGTLISMGLGQLSNAFITLIRRK